ncbi:MAG TPA: translation initiation factor IF-3 [Abditibacteriaceae bacterium]
MTVIGLRPRSGGYRDNRRDQTILNERIRYPQIRVIDDQNAQLGVMNTRDALDLARERDLDLIVVAPQAQPPVCRIMDYGKFKYEKSKREKEARAKGKTAEMKMVRLKPVTSEHDRGVLVRHTDNFLRHGHKVRVICRFQGRQNAHPEIGRGQLDKVAADLKDISSVEGPIMKQGRDMIMNLAPRAGLKPLPKVDKNATADEVEFARLQAELQDAEADAQAEAIEAVDESDAVAIAIASGEAEGSGESVESGDVESADGTVGLPTEEGANSASDDPNSAQPS